jgi:hypothetical protein
MSITWMRTSDAFPDLDRSDTDFTAFDGKDIIGRVHLFENGPEQGLWLWTMTATGPGWPFTARSGRERQRGEAGRRVVEAYERLLRLRHA